MSNGHSRETSSLRSGASFIEIAGNRLTVGNALFRRIWRIEANGFLSAESFGDRTTGREWLASASESSSPIHTDELPQGLRSLALRAVPAPSVIAAESLTAELTVLGETASLAYLFQVFPNAAGVRIQLRVTDAGETAPQPDREAETGPSGVEHDPMPSMMEGPTVKPQGEHGALESLTLAPLHLRLTQVTLRDQTDHHNELVFEREWLLHTSERAFTLSGCLFSVEDVLTGAGLIFLKEAPLPHARPALSPDDLHVSPEERRFTLADDGADTEGEGYAFVTLAYRGGTEGRIAALQHYQRCLRPYVPDRDGLFVANTWGDRNRDGRIQAEFMAQEIEAGARLGVDVIQIDDGWQVGATSNSVRAKSAGGVWEGFYAAREDFWAVNAERFPQGLEPLVAAAREKCLRFGLWFAPDSADDFAHWRRDAATVVRLHREMGIQAFKIDGVKLRSEAGQRNLRAFFDRVLTETAGRVVFDLDITAETRPGPFGLIHVGPVFVENRYTDWRRYWPHQTLRNLWKLSHHVDPVRLRMEWLNQDRHQEKYADDPLAPAAYRPDYLFATVMFSSPLGWFETSHLPESYFEEAAPLIAVWKQHREAVFSGTILPIGDAPDGTAWTGFVSITADGSGAYLLLFREHNRSPKWSTIVPFLPDVPQQREAIALSGEGTASLLPGRVLTAALDKPQRFLFAHLPASSQTTQLCITGKSPGRRSESPPS